MSEKDNSMSNNVDKNYRCLDSEEEVCMAEMPIHAFSRQMREPLADIFAALPLMAAHLDETGQKYIESVLASSYQLLRLACNVENSARLGCKRKADSILDIASVVNSLCVCIELVCKQGGIPITWKVSQTPLPVFIGADLFSDIFLYLIRNSLQYTRDGNQITVTLKQVANKAVLTVADLGMGIKPEVMPKIFEPYYSINPYADTNTKTGIGISLYTAKQAVQQLGGTVSIESKFGEGTSVHIALPLSEKNEDTLLSAPADYLLNRFSAVFVQLCGLCRIPEL